MSYNYLCWMRGLNRQNGLRPWMILISTTTIAMTRRIWIYPPMVYPLTKPKSHKITRITKMVQSIQIPFPATRVPICIMLLIKVYTLISWCQDQDFFTWRFSIKIEFTQIMNRKYYTSDAILLWFHRCLTFLAFQQLCWIEYPMPALGIKRV